MSVEPMSVPSPHLPGPGALGARLRSALPGSVGRLALPLVAVGAVVTLVLTASAHWDGWVGGADVQVTDNASIRADMTRLGVRVAGTVRSVAVADYQRVKAGDVLLELDPAEFQVAVAQAEATVASAQAALDNLSNQMALQGAGIAQADAQIQAAKAGERRTALEADRQQELLRRGLAGTPQKAEQAQADRQKSAADARAATAQAQAQRRQLDVLKGQERQRTADLRAAEAALEAARLRLSYTRVTAPFDGVVGEVQAHAGDYVATGASLVSLVPLPLVHVTANYKETQLTRVAPGQVVEISVDMFPGQVLRGHVARLSPASGATFALLPPDNATGNFTKVVQRIPVRIDLDPGQPLVERLRPGMSVETRIHVGQS
ncbi:HlyD family secretion protein [Niveispirillum sp. KHB5.9]|uniref:HlyD family secretion protein n=1 Tax=Niveispirillum sp. KHB5.9 TaxID=3400269 RepID=UPI003A865511